MDDRLRTEKALEKEKMQALQQKQEDASAQKFTDAARKQKDAEEKHTRGGF